MFNWTLFSLLIVLCVPGILIVVPNSVKTMQTTFASRLSAGQSLPPLPVMAVVSSIQSIVLVAIAAAAGILVAPRVGLGAPLLAKLAASKAIWPELQNLLPAAIAISLGGATFFLLAYYFYFRPRLDKQTIVIMEDLRGKLGIWGRIFYGGIVEEVLMRWGMMSLLAWLGMLIVGEATPAVIWAAIIISGVLFGLGHLPGYLAAGCRKSPMFVTLAIVLNLWASLIFGWLFWQYSLLAAIVAHMLFHLVWWPFDRHYARQRALQPRIVS